MCFTRYGNRADDTPFIKACKRVVRRYVYERSTPFTIHASEYDSICDARPTHRPMTDDEGFWFTYVTGLWYDVRGTPQSERWVGWVDVSIWESLKSYFFGTRTN
jgi:hypothetical protein